ncbi:MAG: hypothetical protein WCK31_02490 [bacterium]
MDKLSKNVLEKIKENNVKPLPKWEFLLKKYFILAVFTINLILGSFGFSLTIYLISNNEVLTDTSLASNLGELLVFSIPFVWILFTIFCIFVAYYNFKHSEEGYKYSIFKVMLISIGISIILGFAINFSGISGKLNTIFDQNIPIYSHTVDLRSQVWMRPEEGYLSGTIKKINLESNTIEILDLNNQVWEISIKDAFIKGRVKVQNNEKIKILGKETSDTTFNATEIRPWMGQNNQNGMSN